MANIRITATIGRNDIGGGWKDPQDATMDFADLVYTQWNADMEPFHVAGHTVQIKINISDNSKPVQVVAHDDYEISGTLEREVEDTLTPENDIWDDFLASPAIDRLVA